MNIQPITLTGQTVRLEPLTPAHAADLNAHAHPDIFTYYAGPTELSVPGFEAWITMMNAATDRQMFATIHLTSGQAIGVTSFMEIRPAHRGLEIGFTWTAKAHQGTKVNPESKYLLLEHAFEVHDAIRVQLKTDSRNAQSRAAILKLGASFEGILRNHMVLGDGTFRHTAMFSILPEEWPDVKQKLRQRLADTDS
jgi:RimJ/RimL family protein N-acetyltransferase